MYCVICQPFFSSFLPSRRIPVRRSFFSPFMVTRSFAVHFRNSPAIFSEISPGKKAMEGKFNAIGKAQALTCPTSHPEKRERESRKERKSPRVSRANLHFTDTNLHGNRPLFAHHRRHNQGQGMSPGPRRRKKGKKTKKHGPGEREKTKKWKNFSPPSPSSLMKREFFVGKKLQTL